LLKKEANAGKDYAASETRAAYIEGEKKRKNTSEEANNNKKERVCST